MAKKESLENVLVVVDQIKTLVHEAGATLLPNTATHKIRIEIKSESSNRKYVVSKRDTNVKQWECSCPGWTMHSPRRPCKHLRAMVPFLEEVDKRLALPEGASNVPAKKK